MDRRAWSREQFVLAWVVSAALHATTVILFVGSAQMAGRVPAHDRVVDTRVPAPDDLPDLMAFDVVDPTLSRQPVRTVPKPEPQPAVAPRRTPTLPTVPKSIANLAPSLDPTAASRDAEALGTAPNSTRRSVDTAGRRLHPPLAAGRSVVYVLDRSASMGKDRKLQQAVECIRLSLHELPGDARFQIVTYHSGPELLLPGDDLVVASPANVAAAERALRSLPAEGGSNHLAGIRKALHLRPDAVFLLTDADDLRADHIRAVTVLNEKRTAIHPVLFGSYRGGDSPFQALARQNRGFTQTVAAGKER